MGQTVSSGARHAISESAPNPYGRARPLTAGSHAAAIRGNYEAPLDSAARQSYLPQPDRSRYRA